MREKGRGGRRREEEGEGEGGKLGGVFQNKESDTIFLL